MRLHDLMAVLFVVYVLVLLPRASWRSARVLRGEPAHPGADPRPLPSRERILLSTCVSLLVLGVFAWVTALSRDWDLFWFEDLGARDLLAGGVVLAVMLLLRALLVASRDDAERRTLRAHAWMPRTPREGLLFVLTCLLAGVCEELAYRGMLFILLEPYLGTLPTVLVCSTAFALGHLTQERKSVVVIFVIALLLHALVEFTGRTLVVAMIVHAVYDLFAGALFARSAARAREG